MSPKQIIQWQQSLDQMRRQNKQIIAVGNSEWYGLLKDEIRNSIAIEGVFTDRHDLIDVLDRNKRTDTTKTAAILGYFDSAGFAYEYANNLFTENEFLIRLSDIKQIHTLLMRYENKLGAYSGKPGDFRKENVEVTLSNFTPVKAEFIQQSMQLLIKWINEKLDDRRYNPVRLSTAAHIFFETIHPFRDGNGRVGRILMSYLLIGQGLMNIAIKGTSQRARNIYYEAMETGDDQIEKLLREIEKGHQVTIPDVDRAIDQSDLSRLEEIMLDRLDDAVNRLGNAPTLEYDPEALIPLRDAAKLFHYSQDYLRNLINRNKLPAQKKGKLWVIRMRDIEEYTKTLS